MKLSRGAAALLAGLAVITGVAALLQLAPTLIRVEEKFQRAAVQPPESKSAETPTLVVAEKPEPLVPLEPTRDYYAQAVRALEAEDADLAEKLLKKLADPVDQAYPELTKRIAELRKQPNHAFRQALSNRHNDLIEAIGEDVQRQSNGLVRSEYYVETLQRATPPHVWIHRYEVKMISPGSNAELGLPPRSPGSIRIDVTLQVQVCGRSDKHVCSRVSIFTRWSVRFKSLEPRRKL